MTVTRDFIPEGVEMTPNEAANRNRQAAIRTGANHVDFIPDPESSEPLQTQRTSPEARADRAMEAAVARSKAASDADWDIAVTRLSGWNARQAIEAIQRMPQQVMELYIIAEESSGHRHDILSVFPTPRQDMYHRYAPDLEAEKFGTDEVPTQELPVADLAPEPAPETSADAEVFICTECEHEPFKSLAGFKSHVNAKHSAGENPQAAEDAPQAGAQE